MKKILFVVFIALTLNMSAQSKKMVEKATSNTEYIANAMKLDNADKQFLYETLLNSYKDAALRKKGLSKEEKKEVGKEIRKELNDELSKNFSKQEVKEINALIKEKREKDKEARQ